MDYRLKYAVEFLVEDRGLGWVARAGALGWRAGAAAGA